MATLDNDLIERCPSPVIMTTAEAADYLNITLSKLAHSRINKTLFDAPAPEYIRNGRYIRYERKSLDRWIASLPRGPVPARGAKDE
jgi:hypothetical protein